MGRRCLLALRCSQVPTKCITTRASQLAKEEGSSGAQVLKDLEHMVPLDVSSYSSASGTAGAPSGEQPRVQKKGSEPGAPKLSVQEAVTYLINSPQIKCLALMVGTPLFDKLDAKMTAGHSNRCAVGFRVAASTITSTQNQCLCP
jgi:hypothetical protein